MELDCRLILQTSANYASIQFGLDSNSPPMLLRCRSFRSQRRLLCDGVRPYLQREGGVICTGADQCRKHDAVSWSDAVQVLWRRGVARAWQNRFVELKDGLCSASMVVSTPTIIIQPRKSPVALPICLQIALCMLEAASLRGDEVSVGFLQKASSSILILRLQSTIASSSSIQSAPYSSMFTSAPFPFVPLSAPLASAS